MCGMMITMISTPPLPPIPGRIGHDHGIVPPFLAHPKEPYPGYPGIPIVPPWLTDPIVILPMP